MTASSFPAVEMPMPMAVPFAEGGPSEPIIPVASAAAASFESMVFGASDGSTVAGLNQSKVAVGSPLPMPTATPAPMLSPLLDAPHGAVANDPSPSRTAIEVDASRIVGPWNTARGVRVTEVSARERSLRASPDFPEDPPLMKPSMEPGGLVSEAEDGSDRPDFGDAIRRPIDPHDVEMATQGMHPSLGVGTNPEPLQVVRPRADPEQGTASEQEDPSALVPSDASIPDASSRRGASGSSPRMMRLSRGSGRRRGLPIASSPTVSADGLESASVPPSEAPAAPHRMVREIIEADPRVAPPSERVADPRPMILPAPSPGCIGAFQTQGASCGEQSLGEFAGARQPFPRSGPGEALTREVPEVGIAVSANQASLRASPAAVVSHRDPSQFPGTRGLEAIPNPFPQPVGPEILRMPSAVTELGATTVSRMIGIPVPDGPGNEATLVLPASSTPEPVPGIGRDPTSGRRNLRERMPDPGDSRPMPTGWLRTDSPMTGVPSVTTEYSASPNPRSGLIGMQGFENRSPERGGGVSDPRSLPSESSEANPVSIDGIARGFQTVPSLVSSGPEVLNDRLEGGWRPPVDRHEGDLFAIGNTGSKPRLVPDHPAIAAASRLETHECRNGFLGMVGQTSGRETLSGAPASIPPTIADGASPSTVLLPPMLDAAAPRRSPILHPEERPVAATPGPLPEPSSTPTDGSIPGDLRGEAFFPEAVSGERSGNPTADGRLHPLTSPGAESSPRPRHGAPNSSSEFRSTALLSANISYDSSSSTAQVLASRGTDASSVDASRSSKSLEKTSNRNPAIGFAAEVVPDAKPAYPTAGMTSAAKSSVMVNPQASNVAPGPVPQRPDPEVSSVGSEGSATRGASPEPSLAWQPQVPSPGEPSPSVPLAPGSELPLPKTAARLQELLSGEVVLLQRLRTGSMTAVLRPDPGSELRVELRRRQGAIEIRATVERGDARAIAEGWPELQQQLRGQGIHLFSLERSLEREPVAPSQRNFHGNTDTQSSSSGGRGRQQPPMPEAGVWADGRPGRSSADRGPSSSASPNSRTPRRLLESWA